MNVLIAFPDALLTRAGGLRTQVERTCAELTNLGVNIVFFNPNKEYDFSAYDLVHIFSMNTPTYFKALIFKGKIPLVFSSVMWRNGSRKKIRFLVELFRKSPYMLLNDTLTCREMSTWANLILPNTDAEALWLKEAVGVDINKCFTVPNGADDFFENKSLDQLKISSTIKYDHDFILCVSVLSTRKNLINLANVAYKLNYPLVLVGPVVDVVVEDHIKKLISQGANIEILGFLENSSNEIGYLFRKCKVFCLPSYYETPGIAALEAGLCGANLVITEVGGTKEYFNDYAIYIDPYNIDSLEKGLKNAWEREWSEGDKSALAEHIRNNFAWSAVAKKTLDAYKMVLRK